MEAEKVRESVIAGSWYPGSPEKLTREIRGYLEQAQPQPITGRLLGLIAPHAGYLYSGGVAAHSYALLAAHPFDRVLIVAPSHRAHFPGASIYHLGGYRTPLGLVPLDRDLIDGLFKADAGLTFRPQAHAQEHSLEIQLPFLQVVLGAFKLTPIVMGDQSLEYCRTLAAAIARGCRDQRVLLVASSDLSHYHSDREARRLDRQVLECVDAFDPRRLAEKLDQGNCEACGAGPVITVMLAARELGANRARVLHYANSGDTTGDRSGVVGYMAAALYQETAAESRDQSHPGPRVGVDLGLAEAEKAALRQLARDTIRARLDRTAPPPLDRLTGKLQEPRGAFVTLRRRGELRGCIGSLVGRGPLAETVRDMALQAAFSDPRFAPLTADELADLDLEISVLTPMERIERAEQIQIGTHGLYLKKGHRSGLLLPQVATENDWDRDQFLRWTCRKAGLAEDAWTDPDTEIHVFSADIF